MTNVVPGRERPHLVIDAEVRGQRHPGGLHPILGIEGPIAIFLIAGFPCTPPTLRRWLRSIRDPVAIRSAEGCPAEARHMHLARPRRRREAERL
jgi:hypothetical protein